MSNYRLLMLCVLVAGTCSVKAETSEVLDFSPGLRQEIIVNDLPDCEDLTMREKNENKPCKTKTPTEKLLLALKATGSGIAGVTLDACVVWLWQEKMHPLGGGIMRPSTGFLQMIQDIPFFLVKCSMAYATIEFVGAGLKAIRELREP